MALDPSNSSSLEQLALKGLRLCRRFFVMLAPRSSSVTFHDLSAVVCDTTATTPRPVAVHRHQVDRVWGRSVAMSGEWSGHRWVRVSADELRGNSQQRPQWRNTTNCHLGGYSQRGPQWGPRVKPLVEGLGDDVPTNWSSLQTLFTDFDCRNDQHLKISDNSPLDSCWSVCFTIEWLNNVFGGGALAPSVAHGWSRH